MLFHVHTSILSFHSPALHRMFAQTSLAKAESPNSCPWVDVEGLTVSKAQVSSSNVLLFGLVYPYKCHNIPLHEVSMSNSESPGLNPFWLLPQRKTKSHNSNHTVFIHMQYLCVLLHSVSPQVPQINRWWCTHPIQPSEEAIFPVIVHSYITNSGIDYFRAGTELLLY